MPLRLKNDKIIKRDNETCHIEHTSERPENVPNLMDMDWPAFWVEQIQRVLA